MHAETPPAAGGTGRAASGRLAAIVVVAVAARAISWLRSGAMMNDGATFIGIAKQFAAGEWAEAIAHPFHPLYPLAIAAAKPLFTSWEDAGAFVSILAGGLAVFALHSFLRRAFDATVAWVGALLLAVHPYATPFSGDVQSEGLYIALFLSAVAASWRALATRSIRHALFAGVVAGAAYLVRPEGIGVLLVAGGMVAIGMLRRDWRFGAGVRFGLALGVGALLLMGPYLLVVAGEEGGFRLTRKKSVAAIVRLEARPGAPTPAAESEPDVLDQRLRVAGDVVSELAINVKHAFRLDHVLLALLGLFAVRGRPGPRAIFLTLLLALYSFVLAGLVLSSGYVSMRHVLPPLLATLGYVALGVAALGRLLVAGPARLSGRPVSAGAALAFAMALLLVASTTMALRPRRADRVAVRTAAEWLREQPFEVETVAAVRLRDAYYAGARWERLPPSEGDWIGTLRARGVRYLVVDEHHAGRYPGLVTNRAPELQRLHRTESGGRTAGVWEIRMAPENAARGEGG